MDNSVLCSPKQLQCPGLPFSPTMWFRSTGAWGLSAKTNQPFRDMSSCSRVSQFLFSPPLGKVFDTSSLVFSIWFPPGCSPFFAAESSGALLIVVVAVVGIAFPLCHSHPSLLLPYNTVETAASCIWLCLLAWEQKAGTQWPCSMRQLITASVRKAGSESSVSEMGAWRSHHIVPGGLPSILATESYDIPTIPWLMEIPASVLLP